MMDSNQAIRKFALIGMPGCGKSSIGKAAAKMLCMNYYDTDKLIVKSSGKQISEIFSECGEEEFRKIESRILHDVVEKDNCIIATGGGIVTIQSNLEILKRETMIIFINRPIEKIMREKRIVERPLLKENKNRLYELYSERYTIYKSVCDVEIFNDGRFKDCLKKCTDAIENYKVKNL